jgi:hypothetical protein
VSNVAEVKAIGETEIKKRVAQCEMTTIQKRMQHRWNSAERAAHTDQARQRGSTEMVHREVGAERCAFMSKHSRQ